MKPLSASTAQPHVSPYLNALLASKVQLARPVLKEGEINPYQAQYFGSKERKEIKPESNSNGWFGNYE